ncbi:inorganic phosphate transporter [Pelagibacterium flavum]|uniref:Phosphate transporter n=1 Tax=Pelagibacterium flavum TaxID=2984530 RepID=A0ABY6IM90_9HYPH|nr:inorganic phosphate transporter [Pelagibacterium sp. YIM 151497]UYQ71717.1 inorganic phosphate transporter [Pelagibacterium sp. YIM 151497]|tara:strand:+ start:305 stop:1807 length:1503 start_codon:yes stop_codon:yes gene_type:complete|eukprot:jgi/Tetstr1/452679/TSEL_039715.t1
MSKSAIDKDLKRVRQLREATQDSSRAIAAPGLALVFLLAALVWAVFVVSSGPLSYLVIIATVIAAYMALNIGANDVANNMGPAVGAKALTMTGALAIAAICEAAGALLAGGDVVSTISRDIIVPGAHLDTTTFVLVMMAALLSSALWINLATIIGAPVSTTHSVVGGVVGAGIAAAGFSAIIWPTMAKIAASWVISPVMGGVLAAVLLTVINFTILRQKEKVVAARIWVPVLIAIMVGIFAMYMSMKGLSRVWKPQGHIVLLIGLVAGGLGWLATQPWVRARTESMDNSNKQIGTLFRLPLIFATALLSFAHGANDVANAVGPLAAIVSAVQNGDVGGSVALPIWVLAIGALGLALGLALFGPRLIRTVGEKITKLNEIRGYCVALSAAATVLVASSLGLPVSSTHIAVGAVFGVGFLREGFSNQGIRNKAVSPEGVFLRTDHLNRTAEEAVANYQKRQRRYLVRRQHAFSIGAAWIITVPAAALLAAGIFWGMVVLFGL